MLSPFGIPRIAIRVVEQRGEIAVGAHGHIAATPAISAVRSAKRDVFLTAERAVARAAGSRFDVDDYAIYKHEHPDDDEAARAAMNRLRTFVRAYLPCTRAHNPA